MTKDDEVWMRETLKKLLAQCDLDQQLVFKRMYSHRNLDLPVNDVIDQMPKKKLGWAIQQAQRSVDDNNLGI